MPAQSKKQAIAARIARGIQKGEVKPKAGTASAEMAKMPAKSLKHFTKTETSMPKLSDMAKKIMEVNKVAPLMLNGKEVDRGSLEVDDVDPRDYPDFSDAYISHAEYVDGTPLSDQEIEQLEQENYGLAHELAHGHMLQETDYNWRDDPKLSRDWEKSDVSQDEFERERGLGRYSRRGGYRGGYSGGYSQRPKMVGITFFDVPTGKEEEARRAGLTQFKSGKWGFKHQFDPHIISVASDREKGVVSAAEKSFGKGRFWQPKN